HPEGGGAAQKAAHLAPVVVEIVGAPFALAHVAVVFVQAGAVQVGQAGGVGGKVDRHKVHDDTDAHPVAGVDEIGELGRRAVPARDREIAGGLVAPAAVKGVLGQGQQLHVGVVVGGQPGDQLPGQFLVVVPAAFAAVGGGGVGMTLPAAGVHLVDVHGQVAALVPVGHPLPVIKGEGQHRQPAGRARPQLAGKGVGVGVHLDRAVRLGDAVVVAVPFGGAGDVHPPEAGLVFLHGDVLAAGPAAADRHRLRGG